MTINELHTAATLALAAVPAGLDARGWCQRNDIDDQGATCLRGEIALAANALTHTGVVFDYAMGLVAEVVQANPVTWNDARGRTKEEVQAAALRASIVPPVTIRPVMVCTRQWHIHAAIHASVRTIVIDDSWADADAPIIKTWGSSAPIIETWGSSAPIIKTWGSSAPIIETWGSSAPIITTWASSAPTITTRGILAPTIHDMGIVDVVIQ